MKSEKVLESEIYYDLEVEEALLLFLESVKEKYKDSEKLYIRHICLAEGVEFRLCKFENNIPKEIPFAELKLFTLYEIRKNISELREIYRENDYYAGIDVLNTLESRLIK